MKPPSFEYVAATSVAEAVKILDEQDGEAKVLAGGQSLMPLLNMRLARPEVLVDVARIDGLDAITADGDDLVVGAMSRQRAAERSELVRDRHPFLHAAILNIAHPQNRNQGTVGGSIAHADPAGELPAVCLALGAEITAQGPGGTRTITAEDFFVTYLTTSLETSEMLTSVRFPGLAAGTGWGFVEVARRHGDFAMAGSCTSFSLDAQGHCQDARVVLFGVGAVPARARAAEEALNGEAPSPELFRRVGEEAGAAIEEPLSDVHATAEYRRHVAGVLTARSLEQARARLPGA